MNINTENNVKKLRNAILNNERQATINGFDIVNLPTPQRAGTNTQKISYAEQQARQILNVIAHDKVQPFQTLCNGYPSGEYAYDYSDVSKVLHS